MSKYKGFKGSGMNKRNTRSSKKIQQEQLVAAFTGFLVTKAIEQGILYQKQKKSQEKTM